MPRSPIVFVKGGKRGAKIENMETESHLASFDPNTCLARLDIIEDGSNESGSNKRTCAYGLSFKMKGADWSPRVWVI
jgi:hypothetical protein